MELFLEMYQEKNIKRINLNEFLEAINRQLTEDLNASCEEKLHVTIL